MRISIRIIILLYSLTISFCKFNTVITTLKSIAIAPEKPDLGNKSVEFVNIIREDLRKNNDDYAEAIPQNLSNPYLDNTRHTITYTVNTKHLSTNKTSGKFYYKKKPSHKNNIIEDLRRRAFPAAPKYSEEEIKATKSFTRKETPDNQKRFTKITIKPSITNTQALKYNSLTINDKYRKYVNNDKMVKFKHFLDKNKGLLKEFISIKKMETQSVPITVSERADTTAQMRARDSEERTEEQVILPNPDQLDMAPAMGGRINVMRIKGALCQRSVLIPEGPKYDSKGVSYLPAFTAARGREYQHTRPPALLLPRCCNCCKKSVFGCE